MVTTPSPRDHMARIACSDDVWAEFKRLAQMDRWQPVNEYLGELVVREVERQHRLLAQARDSTARDVLGALDQVKAVRDDLEGITVRLEELAGKRAAPPGPVTPAQDSGADFDPADLPDWEP